MTQTTHGVEDGGGRGLKTIHHTREIAAPRATVFGALTTPEGLSAWWTTRVRADEAALGALLDVTFGGFNPHLRITELDPSTRLGWEGVGGHEAWGKNTTIRFDLETTSGGTRVRLSHQLGRELDDDAVASATLRWSHYLDSLRLLCETGSGKPFQGGPAEEHAVMDSYTKTLLIHASPQQLYRALTTIPGLKSWWTGDTILNNGDIRFGFREGIFQTMRVLDAVPDKKVLWECIAQYFPVEGTTQTDEWVGTRIAFDIQAAPDDSSTLVFTHIGLTPRDVCYDQCNVGWNHFLGSLKRYLEQGMGTPFSGTPWRAQHAATP